MAAARTDPSSWTGIVKEQALAPLTAIVSKAQRLVADLEALYPDAEEAGGA